MQYQSNADSETREISIRLEHYDDIFSDFDIRPYSQRALSIDFLDEIKRASSDKGESGVELILFSPEKQRDEHQETVIKERLAGHFKRHFDLLLIEKRRVLKLGISMVIMGVIAMIAATFVVYKDPTHSALLSFLVVFLEPAAWFMLWEGMDQIIFHSKNVNPELDFYRKMSNSHDNVHFRTY
jgi:hypothetical protein